MKITKEEYEAKMKELDELCAKQAKERTEHINKYGMFSYVMSTAYDVPARIQQALFERYYTTEEIWNAK